MKSLLVAAGLFVGASAWADATTVYERGGSGTAWSTDDVAGSGTDLNVWIGNFVYNADYGLYCSGTGARSSVMTFSHTNNAIQTFDIVFNNLGNTGNAGNYSYLKIGSDIEIQSNQQNQNGAVIINGNSTAITDCNIKNYNRGGDLWTIHVEVNTAKNTVTALTIVGETKTYGSNSKYAHYTLATETPLSNSATYNTVTIGFTRAGGTPAAALTSIIIAEEAQTVTNADYTINYNFGGTTVKSESGTSTVDATINAELPITVDGQKYYAADGATTSITLVDGTNVLNVDLRKANEYAYSVSNNFGTSIAAGKYIEGESAISVSWSKYVKNGDKWYECDETSYSLSVSGALTKTINYTNEADIAYFFECEDLNVSRSPAASDTWSAWSGGKAVRHYSSSYWYTDGLAGGVYNLSVPYKNNNSSATTINLYLRDSEGTLTDTGLSIEGAKQSSGTLSAEGIEIPEGYSLVLNNTTAYNSNVLMDYVALTLVRPLTVAPAVTDYATFSSPYALNFATATGVQAYVAKSSDGSVVTMEKVTGAVPANTGLLLQKMDGEVSIPVVAEGVAPAANLLKPGTGAAIKSEGTTMRYVLAGTGDATSFYCLAEANAAVVIPEGKAYLEVVGAPARLAIVFEDGETTGIKSMNNVQSVMDNEVYNLQGQRVQNAVKGLYIVNGKKVVRK